MKQIHLHEQAREYAIKHIQPLTEKGEPIDMVTHLQYFALLMIQQFADQNDIEIYLKSKDLEYFMNNIKPEK